MHFLKERNSFLHLSKEDSESSEDDNDEEKISCTITIWDLNSNQCTDTINGIKLKGYDFIIQELNKEQILIGALTKMTIFNIEKNVIEEVYKNNMLTSDMFLWKNCVIGVGKELLISIYNRTTKEKCIVQIAKGKYENEIYGGIAINDECFVTISQLGLHLWNSKDIK